MDALAMAQLVVKARDVETHLNGVAKPHIRRDKGGDREPPIYAFGSIMAGKAENALRYSAELQSALQQGDFEAALKAAQEIDALFPE
jgi:hypothetical protein